jgi:replication factor A1
VNKVHSKSFNFSCRAKQETFQEQTRVKFGVTKLYPLDYALECRNIHKQLAAYTELKPASYLNA